MTFINAYLISQGADPVNLDRFRTLPSSKAIGAQHIGRLTVDTSYWTLYRSRTQNPDSGDTFAPAIPGLLKGQFPAIPRHDGEPTFFLSRKFPVVSIIRPTQLAGSGGAVATVKAFTADGLFIGQPPEFFAVLNELAQQADAARRGL